MSIAAAVYLATFSFLMPKADIEGSPVNGLLTPRVYCAKEPSERQRLMAEGDPSPALAAVSMQVELTSGTWICFVTVKNEQGKESKPNGPAIIIVP